MVRLGKWMQLENLLQCGVTQTQKDKGHMFPPSEASGFKSSDKLHNLTAATRKVERVIAWGGVWKQQRGV